LSKLRVHDLAGEFGVSSDEVINLLRQMDVPVRSHLSPLSDDQVARIRARWEREKRARVATANSHAAPPRNCRDSGTGAQSGSCASGRKQHETPSPSGGAGN